jgi:hypothetical protein
MAVELVMLVTRSEDNHLSGTVRATDGADAREFSGMLELMRVFEDLVPVDRGAHAPDGIGLSPRDPGPSGDAIS